MVGELITLPLRVGVRVTQFWLRAAGGAAGVVFDTATHVLDRDRRVARPTTPASPAVRSGAHPRTTPTTDTRPPVPTPGRAATASPLEDEPTHVSEEPELVEELAEPGAEDGAGAELHVREPWSGYAQGNAEDVISRLAAATSAELAAVELYESTHQARQTILAAVETELRKANGSGSPTQERNR